MLVYGDHSRIVAPQKVLSEVAGSLSRADGAGRLERSDLLTRALVLAGELLQGVADAAAEAAGYDDWGSDLDTLMDLGVAVGGRLLAASGVSAIAPDLGPALRAARRLALPPHIRCKTPESYAFYALYPERYAAAVEVENALVIGLRSIGTSLAAIVAARLGCAAVAVRPLGHPFRRALRVSERLRARLAAHRGSFVIVDEGPGLSGSSFGAAADLLESLGVPLPRIVFVPTHRNELGPMASSRQRARYARTRRQTADEPIDPAEVAGWFADIVGPRPRIEDLSGGAWRPAKDRRWPASPSSERLKFRLTGGAGRFVARFAGLGNVGERKLEVASRLNAAGFTPEPLALRRGFLLERWVDGAPFDPAPETRVLVSHLAHYLGFRARELPAGSGDGASFAELRRMAVANAGELGDVGLADTVGAHLDALGAPDLCPVYTDSRLHAWEWLRDFGGALVKTDAIDHAAGHDLVGCQDIAWDIAGASVEYSLPAPATQALREAVGVIAGRAIDPGAVAAFCLCYPAFQGGSWRMIGEPGPRTEAEVARYTASLRSAAAASLEMVSAGTAARLGGCLPVPLLGHPRP